jgi:hypothetical protein
MNAMRVPPFMPTILVKDLIDERGETLEPSWPRERKQRREVVQKRTSTTY